MNFAAGPERDRSGVGDALHRQPGDDHVQRAVVVGVQVEDELLVAVKAKFTKRSGESAVAGIRRCRDDENSDIAKASSTVLL